MDTQINPRFGVHDLPERTENNVLLRMNSRLVEYITKAEKAESRQQDSTGVNTYVSLPRYDCR